MPVIVGYRYMHGAIRYIQAVNDVDVECLHFRYLHFNATASWADVLPAAGMQLDTAQYGKEQDRQWRPHGPSASLRFSPLL